MEPGTVRFGRKEVPKCVAIRNQVNEMVCMHVAYDNIGNICQGDELLKVAEDTSAAVDQ